MTTVNALKCKHPENEAKMHFTYLWQCLAHSNSTSKHQENPMSTYHTYCLLIFTYGQN